MYPLLQLVPRRCGEAIGAFVHRVLVLVLSWPASVLIIVGRVLIEIDVAVAFG